PPPRRARSGAPPALGHLGVLRAGVGRAEEDHLRTIWAALQVAHRLSVDADRVEGPQLEHLVVELDARAPADENIDFLLLVVVVPEWKAVVRRHAQVADRCVLRLERD